MNYQIAIVIVIYNHDSLILETIINQVKKFCNEIIIVNNNKKKLQITYKDLSIINNMDNLGIAKGYNQGIDLAIENKNDIALLLDQDSIPNNLLISSIPKIPFEQYALIGVSFDEYIEFSKLSLEKMEVVHKLDIENVIFNITSGSFVNLAYFKNIGIFDEKFFMEYVDTEWCQRAKRKGYEIIKIKNKMMFHKIGNYQIKIFNRIIHIHEPERYYYKFRNGIYLILNEDISYKWKIKESLFFIIKIIIYPMISRKKLSTLRYIYFGIIDGIKKRFNKKSYYN